MAGQMKLGEGQTGLVGHDAQATRRGRGQKEVRMKRRQLVLCSLVVMLLLWSGPGWAQQPKPGGTLRLALAADLTFFNANQGPAPGYPTFWTWNNIFNSL